MLQIVEINLVAAVFLKPLQSEQVRALLCDITADKMADFAQLIKGNTRIHRDYYLYSRCAGGFGNRSQTQ
ncbi:hypothetical protein D3C75_1023130 [compost metagenome]